MAEGVWLVGSLFVSATINEIMFPSWLIIDLLVSQPSINASLSSDR